MQKCADCARVKIFSRNKKGNGKCKACNGTGEWMPKIEEMSEEQKMSYFAMSIQADCPSYNGTSVCPTCKGAGIID